jgi:hypothetical protein
MEPNRVRLLTPDEDADVEFTKRRFPVVIIISSQLTRNFLLFCRQCWVRIQDCQGVFRPAPAD